MGGFQLKKAYGSHIIDTANGFINNNCNVSVFSQKHLIVKQ